MTTHIIPRPLTGGAVTRRSLAHRLGLLAALLWLPAASTPLLAQDARDGFDPGADGSVHRLFVQDDGQLLVAGDFTSIGGATRSRLARLRIDGTADPGFSVTIDGPVDAASQLADGRILITGRFTEINGIAQPSLALLRADGSVDTGFTLQPPGVANTVSTLSRQADGKILLGGNFDRLGGQQIKGGVARLRADGSLDGDFAGPLLDVAALASDAQGRVYAAGAIFQPPAFGFVRLEPSGALDSGFLLEEDLMWALFESVIQLDVQSDGAILAAGPFTLTRDGRVWSGLLRIRPDGRLDESFRPAPEGEVRAFALQPDGDIVVTGTFTVIGGVARAGVARLRTDGSVDAVDVAADGAVQSVVVQGDGKITLGGAFATLDGVARAHLGRLESDGTLERDFIAGNDPIYPGVGGGGFFGGIESLALQPDGKLLIVGGFGFIGADPHSGIARIAVDGSVDTTFHASDVRPDLVAVQRDGRIVIAGSFTSIGGVPRYGIARLHADGTLDTGFVTPDWTRGGLSPTVTALLLLPNGKIAIAGYWRDATSASTLELARFNADGSADTSFVPPRVAANYGGVAALAQDAQGRLLFGGKFNAVDGVPRLGLARLHEDGSLDVGFDVPVDEDVMAIQVLPDGRIVIGGWFTTVQGSARGRLARLSAAGSLDASFAPNLPTGVLLNVQSMVLQSDGALLIGGFADTYEGRLLKIGPDGAIDPAFVVTADAPLGGIAQQADGKLFVTGGFQRLEGVERSGLARLAAPRAASRKLQQTRDGRLRWTFGGTAPDLRGVRFDYSLDGSHWLPVGAGVADGTAWTAPGTVLPAETDLWIRGQGWTSSARRSLGSSYAQVVRVRTPSVEVGDRLFADGFESGAN